jgi:hypothetical protein
VIAGAVAGLRIGVHERGGQPRQGVQDRTAEQTLDALSPLRDRLLANRDGLINSDGEGLYDSGHGRTHGGGCWLRRGRLTPHCRSARTSR